MKSMSRARGRRCICLPSLWGQTAFCFIYDVFVALVKFVEHHCRAITSLWHGFSFACSPAALVRSSIWWSSSYSWATLTHLLFPLRKQAKLFRSWWKQNIAFKASLVKMFVHLAHLNNVASRKGWKNKHWVFMMEQDHYHLCWSNCSNCNGNSKTPQQSRIKLNKTGNNSPGMHPFTSFRYWYGAMCQCRNPVLTMHHKSMESQYKCVTICIDLNINESKQSLLM